MKEYTNYELNFLIKLCREHDETAFSELISRYNPMINKIVSGFSDSSVDLEVLYSEAVVALHKAAMGFDISQDEVTFGLYAKICIRNRIISYARKLTTAKKREEKALNALFVSFYGEFAHGKIALQCHTIMRD